jgi:hypothetical protein
MLAHQRSKIVQPTNGQKSCSPLNGQKIGEITVLPIKTVGIDEELRLY